MTPTRTSFVRLGLRRGRATLGRGHLHAAATFEEEAGRRCRGDPTAEVGLALQVNLIRLVTADDQALCPPRRGRTP